MPADIKRSKYRQQQPHEAATETTMLQCFPHSVILLLSMSVRLPSYIWRRFDICLSSYGAALHVPVGLTDTTDDCKSVLGIVPLLGHQEPSEPRSVSKAPSKRFSAPQICVRNRRVDEFWNVGGPDQPRPPKQAESTPAGSVSRVVLRGVSSVNRPPSIRPMRGEFVRSRRSLPRRVNHSWDDRYFYAASRC